MGTSRSITTTPPTRRVKTATRLNSTVASRRQCVLGMRDADAQSSSHNPDKWHSVGQHHNGRLSRQRDVHGARGGAVDNVIELAWSAVKHSDVTDRYPLSAAHSPDT